jgi:2-amino-4-hydroxy-6-hydroxymethyldihydropteridine diphosphokinase
LEWKLNASGLPDPTAYTQKEHLAHLCLGSNISPVENLREAIDRLRQNTRLLQLSTCWESAAIGSPGPNFLNIGVLVATPLEAAALKEQVLAPIEKQLGRVRSADKYAPRTIDIDIILFDGQILDPEIWRRTYLALIVAELIPNLHHPSSGEALAETAKQLQKNSPAIPHPEIEFAQL